MPNEVNPFQAPQTTDSNRPEIEWAASQPQSLRRVKLGLTLVYTSICSMILLVLIGPVFLFSRVSQVSTPQQSAQQISLMVMLFAGLLIILGILYFTGELLCLAAPREAKARPYVIVSLLLQVITFVLGMVLPRIVSVDFMMAFQIINNLLGIVSIICFLLFIRSVSLFIERSDVAARAVRAIVVNVVSVSLLFGSVLASEYEIWGYASWGILVGGLVMFANSVTYLRKAITV